MRHKYHKTIRFVTGAMLIIGLAGCNKNSPALKPTYADKLQSCYMEYYGQSYDSVAHNVFALDLYSEGLTLDSANHIVGSGTNLYISDIFVSDTALQEGVYHSSTGTEEHTFLPGQDFEGIPTGIYVLSITDGSVSTIQVIDSGRFVVQQTNDSLYNIRFTLYYNQHTYEPWFEGNINYYDAR